MVTCFVCGWLSSDIIDFLQWHYFTQDLYIFTYASDIGQPGERMDSERRLALSFDGSVSSSSSASGA